ncbi:MAG: UDP-N-acetylmuramate dehydrogenase [Alphaproteobacteria bacterium]|nr:UDP-N-acetylmuramate dehydrogenase [Alphaproteobacteria bacterium]
MTRLPAVRGRLMANAPFATWFRAGGPAEILFSPADEDDLAQFLASCPDDVPVTVLGVASNTLVRDGGVPGAVVKLGPAFAGVKAAGETVRAGAGAVDLNVASAAQAAGIEGLEFLCGIPGTVGGGLRMNAGAYGREFKDIVVSVEAVTRKGERRVLSPADMGFHYRHTHAPEDLIFTSALLRGLRGDAVEIQARMTEIQKSRAESQPIREKTGGSTFANPPGQKAWQLIEAAGCRGLKRGEAMMSDKHCNFLINTGNATAADIENLGEEVRQRVKENSGIDLRWEIKRIGVPS